MRLSFPRCGTLSACLSTTNKEMLPGLLEAGRSQAAAEGTGIPAELFRDFLLQDLKSKMEEERHG